MNATQRPAVSRASRVSRATRLRDRVGQLAAGIWLGLLAVLRPDCAAACSACLRNADNRMDFIVTTGLLTFLPLIAIGAVVWWLRRRVLAMESEGREAELPRDPVAAHGPVTP